MGNARKEYRKTYPPEHPKNIDNLLGLTKSILTKTLLFSSNSIDTNTNINILNVTKRFG